MIQEESQRARQFKKDLAMSRDPLIAYDDAGVPYTIHMRRSFINARTFDDPLGRSEGRPSFHLPDGSRVNKLDKDSFQIVATGVIIRARLLSAR